MPFKPKYHLGHPENYLSSLSKIYLQDQSTPKINNKILKKTSLLKTPCLWCVGSLKLPSFVLEFSVTFGEQTRCSNEFRNRCHEAHGQSRLSWTWNCTSFPEPIWQNWSESHGSFQWSRRPHDRWSFFSRDITYVTPKTIYFNSQKMVFMWIKKSKKHWIQFWKKVHCPWHLWRYSQTWKE